MPSMMDWLFARIFLETCLGFPAFLHSTSLRAHTHPLGMG